MLAVDGIDVKPNDEVSELKFKSPWLISLAI